MNIGTSKPSIEELSAVKHYMIDLIEPSEHYSAFSFARNALSIIKEAAENKKKIIICGGTGFYFENLQKGIGVSIPAHQELRTSYHKKILNEGNEGIYQELQKVDPVTAARLHLNDTLRIVRALEIFHTTGKPLSLHGYADSPPENIDFRIFILNRDREVLYRRINTRVEMMIRDGLWEEFLSLSEQGYRYDSPGMRCVGYHELFDVHSGKVTLNAAIEKIKQHTRNYAKRQITWFKNKTGGKWVDVAVSGGFSQIRGSVIINEGIKRVFEEYIGI
jgi:tRNA dimethylallyltransferase